MLLRLLWTSLYLLLIKIIIQWKIIVFFSFPENAFYGLFNDFAKNTFLSQSKCCHYIWQVHIRPLHDKVNGGGGLAFSVYLAEKLLATYFELHDKIIWYMSRYLFIKVCVGFNTFLTDFNSFQVTQFDSILAKVIQKTYFFIFNESMVYLIIIFPFCDYCKCNFPMTTSVRQSISLGWSVSQSVCHNFLKGGEVTQLLIYWMRSISVSRSEKPSGNPANNLQISAI